MHSFPFKSKKRRVDSHITYSDLDQEISLIVFGDRKLKSFGYSAVLFA